MNTPPRPDGLGWGLIGASDIAERAMIGAIRSHPACRVAAVMSRDPARGRAFASRHGIPAAYDRLADLLADPGVGAVYISTTNERHCDETLAAAAAGRHVLCEKPLALSLAEARRMVQACREAGVVLATNHHLRNAASHRAIREAIAGGRIGRVLAARVFHAVYLPERLRTWRLRDPGGGGAILDIVVHDADVLRFVLDDEPLEVVAITDPPLPGTDRADEVVMAAVRFAGGAVAQIHAAFNLRHAGTGLEVHGSEGSIVARDVMGGRPGGDVVLRTAGGAEPLPLAGEDLYARAIRHFVAATEGRGEPVASGDDGLRALALALAVRRAAAGGERTPVEAAPA